MDKYIMLITYSFDTDYIAIPCNTEEEAKEWLEKYLHEEILTIKNENEYEPIVKRNTDNDVELIYEEEGDLISDSSDRSYYKIIKPGNGFNKNTKFYYTELEKEKKK